MIYVISIFGGVFIVLSLTMLYVFYREQHFGTFLMAITYGLSGLLAITLPHWWPLLVGFVMVWLLRLMGMEQNIPTPEDEGAGKDEGGRVSREFEEGASAPSSRRTPDAMQRIGPGSETKDEGPKA